MLLKQLYYMYYNTRAKSAPKGDHCSVLSPHIATLESNNLQIKRRKWTLFGPQKEGWCYLMVDVWEAWKGHFVTRTTTTKVQHNW